MIQLNGVSLRRGNKLLIANTHLHIHAKQKIGVTGANGCGKSSLFALLLGVLQSDAGDVEIPSDLIIAHLAQEVEASQQPAIEYVLDGDTELRTRQHVLRQAEECGDGEKIAHLHTELEQIGGYQANSKAARLMHGLGFKAADENRPIADFSGGWRMRLNLAKTLMCRSDVLLLDEPTNHLDLDAVIWLENWLRQYPGALLLISHDRDFLDCVVNHILHIAQQQAELYTGNYSAFEHMRAGRLAHQQAAYQKQQRDIAHMRSFVERFRAKATKAKQAQSRLKALEKMQLIAPAHIDSPFQFGFKTPHKNPHPLLKLEHCQLGYGAEMIIQQAQLTLGPGDRLGLLGPNGAGKSTLIKCLAGELQPRQGERIPAKDLKIGYFAQHQLEQLHPEHSPLAHLQQLDKTASEQALRDFLGGFGFSGDQALQPVAPFSGGEKSRLVLAILVYQRPNLLLLDEPTNHLDIEMRQALAIALQDFAGAMVIVSHDRHLLRTCCDELVLVYQAKVEKFTQALDDYPAWLALQSRQAASLDTRKPRRAESADGRKARKRAEAEQRKQLQPLKKALQKAENTLEEYQLKQQALEKRLADNSLYNPGNKDELNQLLQEKALLDRALEDAELDWLRAMDALETQSGKLLQA